MKGSLSRLLSVVSLSALTVGVAALSPSEALGHSMIVSSNGDLSAAEALWNSQKGVPLSQRALGYSALAPLRVSYDLPEGRAQVTLNGVKFRTWNATLSGDAGETDDASDVVLLQGQVELAGERRAAAGSIVERDGEPVLRVVFQRDGKDGARSIEVRSPLNGEGVAEVSDSSFSSLAHKLCGTTHERHGNAAVGGSTGGRAQSDFVREIELATDADYEWYARYGSSANTEIASIINAVNTIYQGEIGLVLSVVNQNVWTTSSDPFPSTDSEVILQDFQDYANANSHLGAADLYHLFSGKNFDGSTIGIAYLGVTCDAPSYAYGTSSDVGSLTYAVVAHEIGHNLNADHDLSLPETLMYPSLGSNLLTFSSTSRSQISTYTNGSGGSCFSDTATPDPRLDPSRLSVSVQPLISGSGNVQVTVLAPSATSLSCQVTLEMSRSSSMSSASRRRMGALTAGRGVLTGRASSVRVRVGAREPADIYFRARVQCDSGESGISAAKRIRLVRSTSSRQPTRTVWISRMIRAFRLR